jgi:hypothetical protein
VKLSTTVIDGVKYVRARAIEQEVKHIRQAFARLRYGAEEDDARAAKDMKDGLDRLEEAVREEEA